MAFAARGGALWPARHTDRLRVLPARPAALPVYEETLMNIGEEVRELQVEPVEWPEPRRVEAPEREEERVEAAP